MERVRGIWSVTVAAVVWLSVESVLSDSENQARAPKAKVISELHNEGALVFIAAESTSPPVQHLH